MCCSLTVLCIEMSDEFLCFCFFFQIHFADAGDHCASPSQSSHSPAGLGNKQHSLRGANKLTRRARSFKEDFLEKLSQIRTPTNTLSLGRYGRDSRDFSCKQKKTKQKSIIIFLFMRAPDRIHRTVHAANCRREITAYARPMTRMRNPCTI